MEPRHAWGAFSVVFVLAVSAAGAILVYLGLDPLMVVTFSACAVLAYGYIVYKRFHVELVPESDVMLFDDSEDLRVLCKIYGLGVAGKERQLRDRLLEFARANKGRSFVWIAPRSVRALASALELERPVLRSGSRAGPITPVGPAPTIFERMISEEPSEAALKSRLLGGAARSDARLSQVKSCPICDSRRSTRDAICAVCGADIEFYIVLSGTRVGRRMVSAKAAASKRKLRYPVASLNEP